MSALKDRWVCTTCLHKTGSNHGSILCPMRMGQDKAYNEASKRWDKERVQKHMLLSPNKPQAFVAFEEGICPLCFLSDFTKQVVQAKFWFEKGSLGFSFLEAPDWVPQAFSVIESELIKAMEFNRETKGERR